jgi:hypothetical protein
MRPLIYISKSNRQLLKKNLRFDEGTICKIFKGTKNYIFALANPQNYLQQLLWIIIEWADLEGSERAGGRYDIKTFLILQKFV